MTKVLSFGLNSPLIKDFMSFPARLYEGDQYYSKRPDLPSAATTPRFFLAFDGEHIIGRACAMINPYITFEKQYTGIIGYYECIDKEESAKRLIDSVTEYLSREKCQYLIGPVNGNTWHSYRWTVPDNGRPFFLDNYHKPWYLSQFLTAGFKPIAEYASTMVNQPFGPFPRLEKFKNYYERKGISIRSINLDNFESDLSAIYSISIQAFQDNFFYSPISWKDFCQLYQSIRPLIKPEFVLLAENSIQEPLGFIFGVTDPYNLSNKTLIIKTVAVVPNPSAKGLGAYMGEKLHQTAHELGYKTVIHALMHEDNVSNNILADISRKFRSYVLLGRAL